MLNDKGDLEPQVGEGAAHGWIVASSGRCGASGNDPMGWYIAGTGAGFIASVVGALIVLFVYGLIARRT